MDLRLLAYGGPIVVGAILLIFLIKPLFARRASKITPYSLNPRSEPLLFAFIEKISRLVRAPMPTRVDLDCRLNASASLRRGALSLAGNDLVLTIGLPLVAGMDMRQFAGVLAHELGHFAQGGGMKLTYLVRSINNWFARVVYERDTWDAALEASQAADGRLGIVVLATRFGVWLSRGLLWLLMMLGQGVSCFLLRQMEYDADSCEAKVCGSSGFAPTAQRLETLEAGTQEAYGVLAECYRTRRQLPDNLPLFIVNHAAELSREIQNQIREELEQSKTGLLDTHPAVSDRIRAAQALNEPGVFHLSEPATRLFENFESLSKVITQLHYREDLELEVLEHNLVLVKPSDKNLDTIFKA